MTNTIHMELSGNCIFPKCGCETPHYSGVPCQEDKCPKCRAKMIRKGSYYHKLLKEKMNEVDNQKLV